MKIGNIGQDEWRSGVDVPSDPSTPSFPSLLTDFEFRV